MKPVSEAEPLRIALLSVHGLIRGDAPELGHDADTGGQVSYVLDLARALSLNPGVSGVELITRLVEDPAVSSDYARPIEPLGGTARIVRLPFGPRRYIRKELLWGHLDSLVDRCVSHFRSQGSLPHVLHSHYADAGYVGVRLSQLLGIPLLHTGHSLGRQKKRRLLESGRRETALERQFSFTTRIAAEEEVLSEAALVVASTRQEVFEQWGAYEGFAPRRIAVIPPGLDTSRFGPFASPADDSEWIDRFLRDPDRPIVLALCRPAPKKNLARLIEAFGSDPTLPAIANLVLVAGSRDEIEACDEATREVYLDMLLAIDRHDLWGKVAIPKRHASSDIPGLYRLAARRRGVFVNPALIEPFGLTLIEAAASGLPVVATANGGPVEILANLGNGLLVDPLDTAAIASALRDALSDADRWRLWSRRGLRGVRAHYSWGGHVKKYLGLVNRLLRRERKRLRRRLPPSRSLPDSRLAGARWALVSDIDGTLLGDRDALDSLLAWLADQPSVAFGVATGRALKSALSILAEWAVPAPDLVISSVGTEIRYGSALLPDTGWARHIRHRWRRDILAETLVSVPGLTLQAAPNQGPCKLSFNVDPRRLPPLEDVRRLLRERGLSARLVYSQDRFLDVLPVRASKGLAVRYLAHRLGLPLERMLVAGDTGNDTEMLLGNTLAVVVGNHTAELEGLRDTHQVYFAQSPFAGGILEGIRRYAFGTPEGKVA